MIGLITPAAQTYREPEARRQEDEVGQEIMDRQAKEAAEVRDAPV
jgi:hypothetical protein